MSKRPSFQFYPADWLSNLNLKRCTHAEKGVWMDLLCLFHDSDEYGVLRWSLKEIAKVIGCRPIILKNLIQHGVLKGSDDPLEKVSFSIQIHSRNQPVQNIKLLDLEQSSIWYSSRLLRDNYIASKRGIHGIKSLLNPAVPRSKQIAMDTIAIPIARSIAPSPTASTTASTIKSKEREQDLEQKPLPLCFSFSEKHLSLCRDRNLDPGHVLAKFKAWVNAKGKKSSDWDSEAEIWILRERQESQVNMDNVVKKIAIPNESRSTVPDYGPGHPRWEMLNGSKIN
jgi:hypothetical protein